MYLLLIEESDLSMRNFSRASSSCGRAIHLQEQLPYVITESLLRGRIVITSNIGGIPETTEGCTGVQLFQANNHEQLAEKMLYIRDLSSDDLVDLRIRNRQNVLSN